MKITTEMKLDRFEAWSGGADTLEKIRDAGKIEELEAQLDELYPDGMTDTELNDLLWFDSESVFEWVGLDENGEEPEESEE